MIESFNIAVTGMQSHQLNVDVIANNLANVNTTGYKKSRIDFEDLMYRQVAAASGIIGNPDIQNPVGVGSGISSIGKMFSDGDLKVTNRDLDIAIQGEGFFEVVLPDGSNAYTRTGVFHVDGEGMLVNADGYLLSPSIQLPSDTESMVVEADGDVLVQTSGDEELIAIGKIELAKFVNPGGLTPSGDNLYLPSNKSGDVFYGGASDEGFGSLAQGFVESSNVELVEEMTNLLLAQRAYEINSKVVQASDDMLSIVNNLRT